MNVAEFTDRLDVRFSFATAATWDPVGLQLGWPTADAGRIGVCHEVTDNVIEACSDQSVDTLVSYHPLLFRPTTSLIAGPTPEGRALTLNQLGVSLIVVHTALDAATPGTGDALLAALGFPTAGAQRWAFEDGDGDCGLGRLLELAVPVSGETLSSVVEQRLGTKVRTTGTKDDIRTVAVLPGSGGSHATEAASIADVLITGDVSHHTAAEARSHGLMVIDAGHAATERPGVAALYAAVCEEADDAVDLDDDPTPWEA